ncbi:MAG: hypothetical protein J4A00_04335 [Gammaproteobacteria bacterium]|nr:hypothetical protein [Gammaproteobacteria bacterium]
MAEIPEKLRPLDIFLGEWALSSESARLAKRQQSTYEELRGLHDAVLPYLRDIMACLNAYPLYEIPAELKPYGYLALMLADIDLAVNRWRSPTIPHGFSLNRVAPLHEKPNNVFGVKPWP